MDPELRMRAERTPNPNSVKWVLSMPVLDGTHCASFEQAVDAEISPLAARLFAIDGVRRVFLGLDFVTVSRDSEDGQENAREWSELAPNIVESIRGWAQCGEPALGEAYKAPAPLGSDEIVAKINSILDAEIRPYVEQDGGDISFAGFSDGVVQVRLRGACEGCPSSTVTLKLAVEARLKEEIEAVQSVIAV